MIVPGQQVLYRVRRTGPKLGGRRSRGKRGEYVVIGVGVVREVAPDGVRVGGLEYQVERDDGTAVMFDGIGLYDHEVRALGGPP